MPFGLAPGDERRTSNNDVAALPNLISFVFKNPTLDVRVFIFFSAPPTHRSRRNYNLALNIISSRNGYISDRGRGRAFALSALRTVRAVLPHTALQSVVSTS